MFSRTQIAGMRDRTAARNYSPERDAFRREHEQHRAWGLRQRHAAKLRHTQQHRSAAPTTPTTRNDQTRPASAQRVPARPDQTPQTSSSQAPTPQTSTPRTAAPRALATSAPAPSTGTPPTPAPTAPEPVSPDAARAAQVKAPQSPAPASRRTPQPTGPAPHTPTPQPAPPTSRTTRTPHASPATAATAGRTSPNFLGRREVVVTVTLVAVRRRRAHEGHPVVVQADKTQEWYDSRTDSRFGVTAGSRPLPHSTIANGCRTHDPPGSAVIFAASGNNFDGTAHSPSTRQMSKSIKLCHPPALTPSKPRPACPTSICPRTKDMACVRRREAHRTPSETDHGQRPSPAERRPTRHPSSQARPEAATFPDLVARLRTRRFAHRHGRTNQRHRHRTRATPTSWHADTW